MGIPYPKHRHKWSKPYRMSTVGFVKACRTKGHCPQRMKAVSPEQMKAFLAAGGGK